MSGLLRQANSHHLPEGDELFIKQDGLFPIARGAKRDVLAARGEAVVAFRSETLPESLSFCL
jgi:hypothetical protein